MSLDNKVIIDRLLDSLHNFLKSDLTMMLSESFKINIKVLSREHMAHRSLTSAVGNNSGQKGVLKTPLGYTGQEAAFDGQCSILSVLLALELNSLRMGIGNSKFCDKNNERFINALNPLNVMTDVQAGEKLNAEIDRFFSIETSPRKTEGYDFYEILSSLSTFYNCQIHVFSSQGQNLKEATFPLKFDQTKEQVLLHMIRLPNNFHLEVISDFRLFQQSVQKYYCFYCDSSVRSSPNKYRHTCTNGRYCLCCKRKLFTDDTWVLPCDRKKIL